MSIALVAHTSASSLGSSNPTTSGIDTTGANLIVVNVSAFISVIGLSDSKGNTWTALAQPGSGGGTTERLFYCLSPTVGSGHTFTPTGCTQGTIQVSAWSGVNALDSSINRIVNPTTISIFNQISSLTPASSGSLIITGVGYQNSGPTISSIDAGLTILDTVLGGGSWIGGSLAYLIQSPAASINPNWTFSGNLTVAGALIAFSATPATPLTATVSDTITFTDALAYLATGLLALSDALSFSDAVGGVPGSFASTSDTLSFDDSVSSIVKIVITLSDALTFLDGFSQILPIFIGTSDSFNFTDNLIPYSLGLLMHFNDSLSFTDAEVAHPVYSQLLNDNFSLTDAFVAKLYINSLLSELLTFADANKVDLKSLTSTRDAVAFSDAVVFAILSNIERNTFDSFSFSDEVKSLVSPAANDYLRRYLNDKVR